MSDRIRVALALATAFCTGRSIEAIAISGGERSGAPWGYGGWIWIAGVMVQVFVFCLTATMWVRRSMDDDLSELQR